MTENLKFIVTENLKFDLARVEKIVGNRQKSWLRAFSPFLT